jgi:Asp-tRNA(Asn)/Glu-tRNA(Gln) amidotransferase A subunit family amidase
LPKSLISGQPYVQNLIGDVTASDGKPLRGMRIAILREHMVTPTANHAAISAQIDQEIKNILRDALGAEIVESITPGYPDDPAVPTPVALMAAREAAAAGMTLAIRTPPPITTLVNWAAGLPLTSRRRRITIAPLTRRCP